MIRVAVTEVDGTEIKEVWGTTEKVETVVMALQKARRRLRHAKGTNRRQGEN